MTVKAKRKPNGAELGVLLGFAAALFLGHKLS
jgi:hypothetical protein